MPSATPIPSKRTRWVRRSLLALACVVGGAAVWDVTTYDAEAWLADYQRLKHDMAHGYANLDWIRDHRGVDLAALDRRTTAALTNAHSRVRAFLALKEFIEHFRDPHVRLEPQQTHTTRDETGDASVASAAEAAPVVASCEDAGYEEGEHAFGFAFERLPGWQPLRGGDFPIGRAGDVGVLRIAQFGEQRYLAACQRVFKPGLDARALQLAVRAEQQRVLIDSLHALQRSGARRLLVDLTGNGGGSEWVSEVIALMTERTLVRAASRHVEPRCDRAAIWRNETRCSIFAPADADETLQGSGPWQGPLMILADGRTASASEDFVAWLQQNGVATVIGERTLGAGCGYVDGGTRTALTVLPLDVAMPNCTRFLENGTNEIEGIAPDIALNLQADDAASRLHTVLATHHRNAVAALAQINPPRLPAPATGAPPR